MLRTSTRLRVVVLPQAVTAMEPDGTLMLAQQRSRGSPVNRNVGSAEFNRVKRVASGLLDFDIAGHSGDGSDAHLRSTQSHDESYGVIRCGIGIDQKSAHAYSMVSKNLLIF